MSQAKQLRDIAFTLHRYIGLAVGLVLLVVGITGSLLVFGEEIDDFILTQQIGQVIPQEHRIAPTTALKIVRDAKANQPELILSNISIPKSPRKPYDIGLSGIGDRYLDVFVNPYTGAIMGERWWENSWTWRVFEWHKGVVAGALGKFIVDIVTVLSLLLSVTGIMLWPGWSKFITGFKIKWNAHPKRTNFDIHKVAGICAAVFLIVMAFTGSCWIFRDMSETAIYAVTFSQKMSEPVSQPIVGKSPLPIETLVQKANTVLSDTTITTIRLPTKPDAPFTVDKMPSWETNLENQSRVFLDQYSGEVLQVQNPREMQLGSRILNSFYPLHIGTFGGLTTRALYVFVGLSPLILFITGFVMWWYRKKISLT